MSLTQLDNLDPEFNGVDGLDPTGIAPEDFSGSLARDTDHSAGDFVAEQFSNLVTLNIIPSLPVPTPTTVDLLEPAPFAPITGFELARGWQLFSWPWPYDLNVVQAFELILGFPATVNDLEIIKNNEAAIYWPAFDFNSIGDLEPGQGYQIKVAQNSPLIGPLTFPYVKPADRIQASPTRIPTNQSDIQDAADLVQQLNSIEVDYSAGWNIIGTLRYEPINVVTAFQTTNKGDITNDLKIAKDYLGQVYLPEFSFNGIGNFNPGEGYRMKFEDDILPSTRTGFKFAESSLNNVLPLIEQPEQTDD